MSDESINAISEIKKRINEVAFAPLTEHGARFEEIDRDLASALHNVEGVAK